MDYVLSLLGGGCVGFALGYWVCHRGLSKAVADARQAALDAGASVSSVLGGKKP